MVPLHLQCSLYVVEVQVLLALAHLVKDGVDDLCDVFQPLVYEYSLLCLLKSFVELDSIVVSYLGLHFQILEY